MMNRNHVFLLLVLFTAGAVPAQTAAAQKKTVASARPSAPAAAAAASNRPSNAAANSFLEQTFGYDPNVKWEIREIRPGSDPALTEVLLVLSNPQGQQAMKLYVTPDGNHALVGDLLPFGADPFAPARNVIRRKLSGPSKGAANAPVTIVEFGDLQCPSCKAAQPILDRLMSESSNARLVFQQLPLVQIHEWAMKAALYGQCVADQDNDAFWRYASLVYQNQEQIKADNAEGRLKDYAGQAGVDANRAAACTTQPATAQKIDQSVEFAKQLEVTATPTVFVGGRKISGVSSVPYEMLKAVVEFMAKQGK